MLQNYKTIKYSVLFSILLYINSNAQTIQWQNTIGGDDTDWVDIIELTSDGNYLSGGYSFSNISRDKTENSRGNGDYWIFKIDDSTGGILWQKTIGGNNFDHLTSAKQTSDGGYILAGYSSSRISGEKSENSRGGDDYWVVKLDSNRNIIWNKTYGGTGTDRLTYIIETADGGYLMGGSSDSNISGEKSENSRGDLDMWLIKINATGVISWQKTFGGSKSDWVESIIQKPNGDYLLAGSSHSDISGEKTEDSNGLGDYWILKIDPSGTIVWQKTIGGNNGDYAKSIVATSDGNYIIGGDSASNISGDKNQNTISSSTDIWLVKINDNGQLLWQKNVGGNSTDTFENLRLTADNGLILATMSYSGISGVKTEASRGERDYWIIKLDLNGNIEWDKTLGGDNLDQTQCIVQAKDGGFVTVGWSRSDTSGDKTENKSGLQDFWIVKLKVCSQNVSASSNSPICIGNTLHLTATGGINYLWNGPNGFTSTDQNPTITNATAINSGEYSCLITGTGGCDDAKKIDVIVGDTVAPIPDLTNLPIINGNCHTQIVVIPSATDACAGAITATTISPLSYSLLGTYTIVWDYDDGNGNISHQNQTITISNQPLPTATSLQSFCIQQNATLNNIAVTGQNLIWYDAATLGNILTNTTTLENKTYYVTQSNNNCESLRLGIAIKIQDTQAPVADANQRFCIQQNATINTIKINGQNIKWYNTVTNGTNLSESSPLENGITYYATQTVNDCESERFPITIQIQEATTADCINFIDELPFPKFFTPNNDGFNDTWTIDSAYLAPYSAIRIFDRYGKLVKQLDPNSNGWDGTYIGQPLPATDYWFMVTRENGKEYKGHFSLKR